MKDDGGRRLVLATHCGWCGLHRLVCVCGKVHSLVKKWAPECIPSCREGMGHWSARITRKINFPAFSWPMLPSRGQHIDSSLDKTRSSYHTHATNHQHWIFDYVYSRDIVKGLQNYAVRCWWNDNQPVAFFPAYCMYLELMKISSFPHGLLGIEQGSGVLWPCRRTAMASMRNCMLDADLIVASRKRNCAVVY